MDGSIANRMAEKKLNVRDKSIRQPQLLSDGRL